MPSFVITEKCDGCKGQDKTACMYICPNDLMVLDKEAADTAIIEYAANFPSAFKTQQEALGEIARTNLLYETQALIEKLEEEAALQTDPRLRMEKAIDTIMRKIAFRLELDMPHQAIVSQGNEGSYGRIGRCVLSQRMEMRLLIQNELLPAAFLEIEGGESEKDLKERFRILNFLVHHEIAHEIQRQKEISPPSIDTTFFPHLNQEQVEHDANEMLIDKLAFETAEKIYVHPDGDEMFPALVRQTIAIDAYLTLAEIILRNLTNGVHPLPIETICRISAVLHSIPNRPLSSTSKWRITQLIGNFKELIKKEKPSVEVSAYLLTREYIRIFQAAQLEED